MHFRIGTRGSKLALWQAYFIQDKLTAQGATTELVIIETKGDKIMDRSLSKIGSKGVFTEELEEGLRNGSIDLAVHSAKDVPSDIGTDFELLAFTEREKTTDVLLSLQPINWEAKQPLVIGTSSTRRIAMLRAYYPHVSVVDMRGNLQTRLRKLEEGACDALLLAYAGVHRMGYDNLIVHEFPLEVFTPAVGQGTVAVEVATTLSTEKKAFITNACNDTATSVCLHIERAFLNEMKGGCSVPVFGNVAWQPDGNLQFRAGVISLDGQQICRQEATVSPTASPEETGRQMAREILAAGGKEILADIRANQSK